MILETTHRKGKGQWSIDDGHEDRQVKARASNNETYFLGREV